MIKTISKFNNKINNSNNKNKNYSKQINKYIILKIKVIIKNCKIFIVKLILENNHFQSNLLVTTSKINYNNNNLCMIKKVV